MTALQRSLLAWYGLEGRSHLPWRQTRDPYRVLVSEFMLQQTQVDRVLPKYSAFLERFPDIKALAAAATADVLRLWKGLGYNSRAVRLRQIAGAVVERFGGVVPSDPATLRALPGIGPYTAGALRAFAFDMDEAAIDTNVRRVVHRVLHGLEHPPKVSTARLDADARSLVPRGRGHDWNSAMMDLGATLCTARAPKCLLCPLSFGCSAAPVDSAALQRARNAHAPKRKGQQSLPFEQTTRFARGRIVDRLRDVPPGERISMLDLHRQVCEDLGRTREEVEIIVRALAGEGLVRVQDDMLSLCD